MYRKFSFFFLLILVSIFLQGCDDTNVGELENLEIRKALQGGQLAFNCHDLDAVIPVGGKLEGPNCIDNKAVFNGASRKCVQKGQCNPAQRLRETNGVSKQYCEDWCAAKNCDYSYTPRSQCDSSWCLNWNKCQQNCNVPLRDTCWFQQPAPNYNCECKDPPPPPQEGPVES